MVRDYVMQWWNVISQLFTRNSRKSILLGQTIKDFAYAAIFLPIRCVAVKTLYYHSYLNIIFHEQRKIWKRKIDRKAIFEKKYLFKITYMSETFSLILARVQWNFLFKCMSQYMFQYMSVQKFCLRSYLLFINVWCNILNALSFKQSFPIVAFLDV